MADNGAWVSRHVEHMLEQLQLGLTRRAERRMKALPTTSRLSMSSSSALVHHLCRELLRQQFERVDVMGSGVTRHEHFDSVVRSLLPVDHNEKNNNTDEQQRKARRHGTTIAIKSVYEFYHGEWAVFIDALFPPHQAQQQLLEQAQSSVIDPPSSAHARRSGFVAGLNNHIRQAQTATAGSALAPRPELGEG